MKKVKKCMGDYSSSQGWLPSALRCTGKASTYRIGWKWASSKRSAKTTVKVKVPLCRGCAALWDESEAEIRWEARVS